MWMPSGGIFHVDIVSSTLQISLPDDKSKLVKRFKSGSDVKIECELLFDEKKKRLCLIGQSIEMIYNVQIVVN